MRWLRMPEKESATAAHMLSNLIWALGALKYRPGDDFFAVFNDVVARRIDEFTDQGVSNVVFTYGNLGVHPDARLLETLDAACLRHMDAFLPQGVANTFWGWATLSAWPSPELADAYRRRLADETLAERFSRIDLVQIYQATLAFDASSSHGEMISGKLQRDAQRVWEQTSQGRVTISKLHRDVSETLTRMGVPHEIERLAADGCFSVDIALRGRKVAIEVDGPSHFLANIMDQRIGADRLRTEYLERKGWKVREPGATSQSRGGKRGGGQTLHPRGSLPLSRGAGFLFAREFFLFLSSEFLLFLSSEFLLFLSPSR